MSSWLRFPWSKARNIVRVIRLQGVIKAGQGSNVNLRNVEKDVDAAFDCKKVKPKAVCLEINSMGGYPVQASLIYERIRYLSKERNVPVFAFAEDYALSGAYWLSMAADEIYVNPSSMIGSIGVITAMFGFQDAIAKLGIERRVYTSGENKSKLDMFQPSTENDVRWLKQVHTDILQTFKNVVKERRPTLQTDHPTALTGEIFVGHEAVQIGLADGVIGDPREVIYNKFGKDVQIQRPKPPFWKKYTSNYGQVSAATQIETMDAFIETLQESFSEMKLKL